LDVTTPAVLFSTISLLMAAYMVRFSAIARLIRKLSAQVKNNNLSRSNDHKSQLLILSKRLTYIRWIHFCGVLSLFSATAAMLLILFNNLMWADICFGAAITFFLLALVCVLVEIYYSVQALDIKLET
jgi:hypothetical protein